MVNWDLFKPRNLFVVALFSLIAYFIFNHFSAMAQKASS